MKTKRLLTIALCLLMFAGAIVPISADDIVTTTPTYAAKYDFEDGVLTGIAGSHADGWAIRTASAISLKTEGEGETSNKYLSVTETQYVDFFAVNSADNKNFDIREKYGVSGDKFVFSYDLRMVGVRAGQMRLFDPFESQTEKPKETFMYHMSGDDISTAVFYKQAYQLDPLDYPNLPVFEPDVWYTLAFAVDLSTNTCDFYIDGRLVAEDDPLTITNGNNIARIRTGMWACKASELNYDNIKLYAAETPDYVNNTPLVPPEEVTTGEENPNEEESVNTGNNTNNNTTGNKNETTETKASETTADSKADTEEKKSGCGATAGFMIVPMALTAGAALVSKKKRK